MSEVSEVSGFERLPAIRSVHRLQFDIGWAEHNQRAGYYDDVPGKRDEVETWLQEARARLATPADRKSAV